jgi:hypothetical protein
VSRYDLFRRRVAPVALFVALALLARESCNKERRTHATFVLELGRAAPEVRAIDAEIWIAGERFSAFHREALPGGAIGPTRFEAALPADDGELRIDATLATRSVHLVRRFHAEDESTVMVPLAADLAAP